MSDLILALDQGTSATKACVYEPPGRLLGFASIPVRRPSPKPGTTEQDPRELVESCRHAARAAIADAGIAWTEIGAAALSNQGESFVLFGEDGPLSPVIGWQDNRGGDVLKRLTAEGKKEDIERSTGLPLHTEFSAPKLAHLLQGNDPVRSPLFGTLDTWLIHELDPARPHITDRATASRTMLISLADSDWSGELLTLFDVPREVLPRIVPCDRPDAVLMLDGHQLPLACSGFDMGLALLGHGCLTPGETKATFGTCLGVMSAAGETPVRGGGLLTTIAYTRGWRSVFGLDGEIAAAGALVEWAIRLGVADSLAELDALAASVEDSAGAVLIPAISGLGAPYWQDDVSATLAGMTDAFDRPQFARAVYDAIAWSLRDVLAAYARSRITVNEIRVDGGLTKSDVLLSRCADVCQVPLVLGAQEEATAYGAAALAMLANGSATEDDIRTAARGEKRVEPGRPPSDEESARRSEVFERWLSET